MVSVETLKDLCSVLFNLISKAYFPLRRKTIRVGSSHWHRPPTHQFRVGYTNMLKFALPPTKNAKICVTPNTNPQRKQVEYWWRWVPNQEAGIGHEDFMLFVSCLLALDSHSRKCCFQWNMGLTCMYVQSEVKKGQTGCGSFSQFSW